MASLAGGSDKKGPRREQTTARLVPNPVSRCGGPAPEGLAPGWDRTTHATAAFVDNSHADATRRSDGTPKIVGGSMARDLQWRAEVAGEETSRASHLHQRHPRAMTHYRTSLPFVSALLTTFACSSSTPPAAAPPRTTPPATARAHASSESDSNQGAVVTVSDDIRRRCGIAEDATHFAYDSSRVSKQADSLLSRVVTCFTEGPLAGATLSLVGHADPRGDEEYNYVLAERRATGVQQRLESLGLPEHRISTTSRGEIHASGTDEATWAHDRRVDLQIGGAG